jgi:anti-sigma regulatory factor (Ser/Thr protein kinase)
MNVTAPRPITDSSQIAEARRAVQWIATRLDFPEDRAGRAALVVSELATNLVAHARGGELLLQILQGADGDGAGIEILALDTGPGIPDVALSRRDGYSTAGTLGHGLGAIDRQADATDLYTHTSGTAIAARIWRGQPPAAARQPRFEIGGVLAAKSGEMVCGDSWTWRMRDARLSILLADGLGHGLPAHEAAAAAVRTFDGAHEQPPARILADVHAALRPTRGAAVAAAAIDLDRGIARYAGVGNIGGVILLETGKRHSMVSHNGTAGYSAARIQEFTYPVPADAILVMFSDGLGTTWDLSAYPGLRTRSPTVIAGVLYRDFSRRRDDVTVVVAKARTAAAEKL